jgi:methylmalonyl-CoA mutase
VNPDSLKVALHACSGMWNKSVYDPYVNVLRLTTECMSAAIGGANAITILPFTNSYKPADEFSSRIARNIQIILKEESYLDKVVDPSAGSYYIESLTDEIAQMAWNQFKKIEEVGGMLAVMENGLLKKDIEKVAAQRDMDIAMRKTPVLGTNIFPNQNETMLNEIQNAKPSLDEHYLKLYRGAEVYEELRLATERFVKQRGSSPKVFLAAYGNLAMRKARATFASNFFACAGYTIMDEYFSKEVDATVKEVSLSKANIVVICSSDEEYAQYACELAAALKKKNSKIQVVVAGYPKEMADILKTAGVDDFIHVKVNVVDTLKRFQKQFGIID